MGEIIINNRRLKLVNDDEIWCFTKIGRSKTYKWVRQWGSYNGGGYKILKINKKAYYYHRVLYKLHNPEWNFNDTSKNNVIDHIDNNTNNNKIENLRVVTQQQNIFNINTARGYYWHTQKRKWRVVLVVDGERKELGFFDEDKEHEARRTYLEAKKKYHVIQ